jgi:hypothetical protein
MKLEPGEIYIKDLTAITEGEKEGDGGIYSFLPFH